MTKKKIGLIVIAASLLLLIAITILILTSTKGKLQILQISSDNTDIVIVESSVIERAGGNSYFEIMIYNNSETETYVFFKDSSVGKVEGNKVIQEDRGDAKFDFVHTANPNELEQILIYVNSEKRSKGLYIAEQIIINERTQVESTVLLSFRIN